MQYRLLKFKLNMYSDYWDVDYDNKESGSVWLMQQGPISQRTQKPRPEF